MAKPSTKSIQQLIFEQKLKIVELEDKLLTQTYLETMPEYGPTYCPVLLDHYIQILLRYF